MSKRYATLALLVGQQLQPVILAVSKVLVLDRLKLLAWSKRKKNEKERLQFLNIFI